MAQATRHLYLIALGSNQRHPHIGAPHKILAAALSALEMDDIDVFAASQIMPSRPVGPSQRSFANAAATVASPLAPPALLNRLKQIEAHFGRRAMGRRWRERTLDLDIILWSGGIWTSENPPLAIPHMQWKMRTFVLNPAAQIAANWRDPITNRTIRQEHFRLTYAKRVDPMKNPL